MRVHAVSDIHVDYPDNRKWLHGLSNSDYTADILILAGDVSDRMELLDDTLQQLMSKFALVCFVPGNHELWISRSEISCSLEKFHAVRSLCQSLGVVVDRHRLGQLSLVPLDSWYDYSFASPGRHLRRGWRDYRDCCWPDEFAGSEDVNRHFLARNLDVLDERNRTVISFSHFLPRIDLMPTRIPERKRYIYPVLGSQSLGDQVARLKPDIHVYGHSHVNQSKSLDGIRYINNAFGYPSETRISNKTLRCVYSDDE